MRVIVSTEIKKQYKNYRVVESVKDTYELQGELECVIIHKPSDSVFDTGMYITKLYEQTQDIRFFYICNTPQISLKACIVGIEGVVLQDEFAFEDEEELNYLLDDEEEQQDNNSADDNMKIIFDFLQAFMKNDSKIQKPVYIESVKTAVNSIAEICKTNEVTISNMSNSAVDIFKQASSMLDEMQRNKENLEKQFEALDTEMRRKSHQQDRRIAVYVYPSYKYVGGTKVLHIQELTPCRYLNSFLIAYKDYLTVKKNKKVKLIFIHQKGKILTEKYTKFTTMITQENSMHSHLINADIISTDIPKSDIMEKVMHTNDDIVIVIDRLYANPILTGTVKTIYAVGGISDLEIFNIKPEKTIFTTVEHPQNLVCIPKINNYPNNIESRQAYYFQACKERFLALDEYMEVV